MNQGDKASFEDIIVNNFENGLFQSLDIYDIESKKYYDQFDILLAEVRQNGDSELLKTISVGGMRDALESVLKDIMRQETDLETKIEDMSNVAVSDVSRMINYVNSRTDNYILEMEIDESRESLKNTIINIGKAGLDIPRNFSNRCMALTLIQLQDLVNDTLETYYRDN